MIFEKAFTLLHKVITPWIWLLQWTQSLIALHKSERALRIGDYIPIEADHLLIFMRVTDKVEDTCIVVINPTDDVVTETVLLKDSRLMNHSVFNIVFGNKMNLSLLAGISTLRMEPHGYVIFKPDTKPTKSYTPYKRV